MWRVPSLFFLSACLVLACGSPVTGPDTQMVLQDGSGFDLAADRRGTGELPKADAMPDAGQDHGTPDVPADLQPDVSDAGVPEVGVPEVGVPDLQDPGDVSGLDSGADVASDVAADGVADAADSIAADLATDSGTDSAPDAPGDAAAETVDTAPDAPQDIGQDAAGDTAYDAGVEVVTPDFKEPCLSNDDCNTGYCLGVGQGGAKVCTVTCDAACPDPDWLCLVFTVQGVKVPLCGLPGGESCKDCTEDGDCYGGEICTGIGLVGTTHCAAACGTDADCPDDYSCGPLTAGWFCLPKAGSCECQAAGLGATLSCQKENAEGVCVGQTVCQGSSGWSVCDAPVPAAETCNGMNDDCDALVDEGFADTDQDGLADCVDLDDDNDGDPDATDCAPADAAVGHLASEKCNGLDDDCNGEADEVDADLDGFHPPACGGGDCDDTQPLISPIGLEVCDGADNDCDGQVDESDPFINFNTDPKHCGSCSTVCGTAGSGPVCVGGKCASLPVHQHRWKKVTAVQKAYEWVELDGSAGKISSSGGPLEIELSIPMVGGDHSTCRPTVDGSWAGTLAGLPSSYIWHEGLDRTGYAGGTIRRMFKRTRVYYQVPAGTHTVAVQCRTDSGTVQAGSSSSTALWIVREFLGNNKVWQQVSLQGTTSPVSATMNKVTGSDLAVSLSGGTVEVTVSLALGNGGHAGCLEWMDGALIPSTPAYINTFWYAGLEATYRGWIMWHHTRTYTGIPAGEHTFSIRCYNDSGTLNMGYADMASVLIVKEIDEAAHASKQSIDAYGNGWGITFGEAGKWYTLPNYNMTFPVTRGALEIESFVDHYLVAQGKWVTCRPAIDGQWAGSFAGLQFSPEDEEGAQKEVFESAGWHGIWHRKRVYTNIPAGDRSVTLQCLSNGGGYYVGHYSHGSMLVREAELVSDN